MAPVELRPATPREATAAAPKRLKFWSRPGAAPNWPWKGRNAAGNGRPTHARPHRSLVILRALLSHSCRLNRLWSERRGYTIINKRCALLLEIRCTPPAQTKTACGQSSCPGYSSKPAGGRPGYGETLRRRVWPPRQQRFRALIGLAVTRPYSCVHSCDTAGSRSSS